LLFFSGLLLLLLSAQDVAAHAEWRMWALVPQQQRAATPPQQASSAAGAGAEGAGVAARAEAGRRHRVIAIGAGLSVAIGVGLAVLLAAPFWAVFALSVVYACFIFSDSGSLPPALLVRVTPAERGAALALMAASANLAACLAVIACGLLLQLLGGAGSLMAWRVTLGAMALGSLVTACCMLVLDRSALAAQAQAGPLHRENRSS
jgi:MFS family permease